MADFAKGDKYLVTRKGLVFILDKDNVVEIKKGVIGTVIRGQDSAGFLIIRFGKYNVPTVATDLSGYVKLIK